MLCLKYKYWLKVTRIDDQYELIKRCREFRTISDAIDHLNLLKETWGKHLVSVILEFGLYSNDFDPEQLLVRNTNE